MECQKRPLALAVAMALCLAASLPAQMLKARGADLDLRLVRDAGEHRLVMPDGGQVALPLSPVAKIGDFRTIGGDWLVSAADRRGEGSTLVVLEGRGDRFDALEVPASEAKAVREPKLLVEDGRLGALLWLEGDADDRLAVRASRWDGSAWEAPVTVSPTGPGTQIALTATVLADGSWLAAWAAFDGEDDEILWSRRQPGKVNGTWSPPRPVAENNAVPDITPALTATANGALLAWSRYDGHDYRVNLARFDGGSWSEPQVVGTRGSAFPIFGGDRSTVMVYRQSEPDAWRIAELDAEGKVLRQAEAAALSRETPVLTRIDDSGVLLEWTESSSAVSWLEPDLEPAPPAPR